MFVNTRDFVVTVIAITEFNCTVELPPNNDHLSTPTIDVYFLFQVKKDLKMNKFIFVLLSIAVVCRAADKSSESEESGEDNKHHNMEDSLCMPHCSYVCMTNGGKPETCLNLMKPNNNTLASLPAMASCPASVTVMNDCFLKCGCQCTRCAVCFMKGFNPMAATAACKASANHAECMKEKKAAAGRQQER